MESEELFGGRVSVLSMSSSFLFSSHQSIGQGFREWSRTLDLCLVSFGKQKCWNMAHAEKAWQRAWLESLWWQSRDRATVEQATLSPHRDNRLFSWGTEKPLSHLATELWSWGHPVGMWDDLCTKSRNALLAVEAVENHKQISWGWPQGTAFRVCKGGEPPDIWWARIQSTFGHLPHPGILTPGCTFDWQEILFWFFLSLLPYLYLTLERPEMVGGGREVKQNQVQIVHAPTALWCRVFVVVVVVVLLCLFFAWDRPKLGSGELDIEWGFKL